MQTRSSALRRLMLVLLVAVAALLPIPSAERGATDTAEAATINRGRVYLIRGIGNVFSLGMDSLAAKLS